MREVDRLARMTAASPEYQMLRTYIDWLLDVPWSVTTPDRLDPIEARRVLDEDHYDLDKVKDRIVEYLAVRKLKGDMHGLRRDRERRLRPQTNHVGKPSPHRGPEHVFVDAERK